MLEMLTPNMLESVATVLVLRVLKASDAVLGDVVLMVNVIVLPARRRVTRSPVRLRRAPESLS